MTNPLEPIYVTANKDGETELRCKRHPRWRADADWTVMDDAFRRADDHIRDDHQGLLP